MVTEEKILELIKDLDSTLEAELADQAEVAESKRKIEVLRYHLIQEGYSSGAINGKNTETRKAQEQALLSANEDFATRVVDLEKLEYQLGLSKIARVCASETVSLYRAWLYSQSGLEK